MDQKVVIDLVEGEKESRKLTKKKKNKRKKEKATEDTAVEGESSLVVRDAGKGSSWESEEDISPPKRKQRKRTAICDSEDEEEEKEEEGEEEGEEKEEEKPWTGQKTKTKSRRTMHTPKIVLDGQRSASESEFEASDLAGFVVADGDVEREAEEGGTPDSVAAYYDHEERGYTRVLRSTDLHADFVTYVQFIISSLLDAEFEDMKEAQQRHCDYFLPAKKRIEDLLISKKRDLAESQAWKSFMSHTQFRPDLDTLPLYSFHPLEYRKGGGNEQGCDACGRSYRPSYTVTLQGRRYDPETLWKSIREWRVTEKKHSRPTQESEKVHCYSVGKFCQFRTAVYHSLHHFKLFLVTKCKETLVSLGKQQGLQHEITAIFQQEKEAIVEDDILVDIVKAALEDDKWISQLFSRFEYILNLANNLATSECQVTEDDIRGIVLTRSQLWDEVMHTEKEEKEEEVVGPKSEVMSPAAGTSELQQPETLRSMTNTQLINLIRTIADILTERDIGERKT